MKFLITGISGFVGGHLAEYLVRERGAAEIVGIDVKDPEFPRLGEPPSGKIRFLRASLLDTNVLEDAMKAEKPDCIVHLASLSSVAESWKSPVESFTNNTNIFLNLVESVRTNGLKARILSVGSSEEYGIVSAENLPLREDSPVNPMNPYAVARVSQEYISRIYAKGFGVPIVCTRSFNHVGPRQKEMFVVSSFVKQAVEVSLGRRAAISCGDLSVVRDFIDVRDVVKCYVLLLEKGVEGEIYNVCSGRGHRLGDVLRTICGKMGIEDRHAGDAGRMRPIDNPRIVGDNAKIAGLGMRPDYDLDRSLDDMIEYWRGALDRR